MGSSWCIIAWPCVVGFFAVGPTCVLEVREREGKDFGAEFGREGVEEGALLLGVVGFKVWGVEI